MAKKILYSSDASHLKTGFGKHSLLFLKYFYSRKNADGTRKYEVIEAAQGIKENDPITRAKPWKCYGLVPENEQEVLFGQPKDQNGNYDPNLPRMVSYGAAKIEEVLKKEKPQIFLNCQDYWGFQVLRKFSPQPYVYYHDTPWFDKFPVVLWHPQDSLPTLPIVSENAHKVKNMWVKASFAQKDLHRLGHKQVELFPVLSDMTGYRAYSEEEKKKNRENYKIPQESTVFGFVCRNQNRKKLLTLLQGFKMFLNSGANGKLILVTRPGEGWDIKRAVKDFDLPPDSVLVPYICHDCNYCELRRIEEDQIDCPNCGGKNLKTISIERGVSEEQLIDIYNLCDGYLQVSDSGGFEIGALESIMCGLPLATVNYAFGESFCANENVFRLDYVDAYEMGSNFLKAQIKPESIAEFMYLVHDEPVMMKERGEKTREWAKEEFDPNKILKRIEDFIDSLPDDHGYNFDFVTEFPQVDAPFPNIESSDEFLKQLYRSFFGQELKETDKNFLDMKEHLDRGATREQIYNQCKTIAQNELAKREKPDLQSFFKRNGKKRLMYELPGDFGDSILCLAPLEALHKLYPSDEWDIYVSCLPQYVQIYEHLDFIAGFVPFFNITDFTIWEFLRYSDKIVDV